MSVLFGRYNVRLSHSPGHTMPSSFLVLAIIMCHEVETINKINKKFVCVWTGNLSLSDLDRPFVFTYVCEGSMFCLLT